MSRADYLAFVDREIGSVMNEGKPDWPPAETFAESASRIATNLKAARFPGRLARIEVDRRWAQVRQLEEAAK